jgi:PKD repeat protein/flagellar hook assembly protein FlgD
VARRRSGPSALLGTLRLGAVRGGLVIAGILLAGLVTFGLARAAEPVDLSVSSPERYFSPNGDGQEDTATVYYCLSQAANVDIWVADESGARVRTIEAGVSHLASPCGSGPTSFGWDGKDDAARVVGDGIYTVHLVGHAADAESGDVTVRIGVDTRRPGGLTSPAPGAVLSGTVEWVFTPTGGFNLDAVSISCQPGGSLWTATSPGSDGRFTGTLDASACNNGDNQLYPAVSWTDPFGQRHSWSAPAVDVTFRSAPELRVVSSERYFSPDGDEQEDTARVSYCLSQPGDVDIWVADGSGARVRTIGSGVAHAASSCSSPIWFDWDGKDDAGQVVADGVYVAHLEARNAAGSSGGAAVRIGVDTRTPGALTTPTSGAVLSGAADLVFTPTSGFSVDAVFISCQGSGSPATTTSPGPDGRFTGTLDVSACTNGDNRLYSTVSFTDPFGQQHSWSAKAVPMTVRSAPQLSLTTGERYMSPNGDGQEDSLAVSYCLSQPSEVDIWVADGSGARVRTIESGVGHDGGCSTWFQWDGMDADGGTVADGVYIAHLQARTSGGTSGDATIRIGVDTRTPGALTSPTSGAVLSGAVDWVFTPTGGFTLDTVSVGCQGSSGWSSGTAGPAGFTGTLDTSGCTDGDNQLWSAVSFTDPFGQGHSWSAKPVPVTVRSAPKLSIDAPERYFRPDGDGREDVITVLYCLSQAADVDIWVADGSGARVRTIGSGVARAASSCSSDRSSFDWDGKDDAGKTVVDGVYVAHLTARNAAGDSGDATIRIGVDTRSPGALSTPVPGDTLAGLARFAFQPTAGLVPDQVDISFDSGNRIAIHNASADGLWRTTMYTGSLPNGPATLTTSVSYRDPFGASHAVDAAKVDVVVDNTALPLAVTADPPAGAAPLATTFHITTSDPQARSVHYTVNFGDGTPPAAGDIDSPYPATDVAHTYRDPGAYRAVVTVTNSAGASSTQTVDLSASGAGNTAPTATLELDATVGVVPLPVKATFGGTDADGDPLTYRLDFGDGDTATTGQLPHDPVAHTFDKAGTYLVRLAVSDGNLTAVRTATVVVGPDEPLAANAGDDQAAVVNDPVRFDGSGSRPAVGIDSYRWDFGDGTTAEGASVDHTYATTGTYTATLTVTAGGRTETDTAVITVSPRPVKDGLVVSVRDEAGAPVAGVELVVVAGSGARTSATTDVDGSGALKGLPDGPYTIYAWRQGYLPAKATATVTAGAGEATVTLKAGQVATASLDATPMTQQEVVAAGIDPTDPDNQHVYEFKIFLAIDPSSPTTEVHGFTASGGFPLSPSVQGGGAGGIVWDGEGATFTVGDYQVSMSVSYAHGQPHIVWLVIPGKATWLKEFFSVQMMVSNLADPDFTLENGAATLTIPEGLTLAPTAVRQSATAKLDAIPGGQSKTATWIVRGDTEGFYDLTASYAGTLEPFGDPVTIQAATEKPLHVWGGSALELVVDADDAAHERHPYHVTVGLKNVADVPVYNPTIELLKAGKKNYIYQPREQLVVTTAELAPGDTLKRDYILVPTISGTLNLGESFVSKTAGDVELPAKLTSHPAVNPPDRAPRIEAFGLKDKVGLTWDPVPGATAYQVYTTPDPATDFPGQPAAGAEMLEDDGSKHRAVIRNVPAGTKAWYAVSPLVNGRPQMSHPLVQATSTAEAPSPTVKADYEWKSKSNHTCGVTEGTIDFTFTESFFELSDYEVTVDGAVVDAKPLRRQKADGAKTQISIGAGEQLKVTARARNSDKDWGPLWSTNLDTQCEREHAVVLAMGLFSSLVAEGSHEAITESDNCPNHPGGRDGFEEQAATNACDAQSDRVGNLVSYLESKGYRYGDNFSSEGRTILEFSYNGAASCDGETAGPTFWVPQPYSAARTVGEVLLEASLYRTTSASNNVEQLKKYSECWKTHYGRELTYTIIGHSLGGYEALAMAAEAASKNYTGLISRIVSVDGAIHPHVIPLELQLGRCFINDGLELPEAVLAALIAKPLNVALWLADRWIWLEDDRNWSAERIRGAQNAGTKVATVTNYHDGCLSVDATLNEAADDVATFYVDNGVSGKDKHAAALKAHGPGTKDPGYPLTAFLDSGYVPQAGSLPPRESSELATAQVAATTAATGRLVGRVVHPLTGAPVSSGQVVAAGGGTPSAYTTIHENGTFEFDELPTGDYRLFVQSFTGSVRGAWVGGSTMEQARTFTVGSGTAEVGDLSGVALPQVTVKLTGADRRPITDGVVVLADAEGRQAATGETDAAGVVTLTAPPGTYSLGAASPSTAGTTTTVDLPGPASVDLELEPAAVVTATIKDQKGAPLPSVAAALYSGEKIVAVGFTDVNGVHSFTGLEPGNYTVKLYEALDRFELPEVVLPTTAKIGDPSAGQVSYTLDQTTVAITSGPPPAEATVGAPYTFSFTASGSPAPTFALASGRLPDGLTLDAAGKLSGAPTTAGTYTFSVTATNPAGTATGGPYTITVDAKPAITSGAPPAGSVGVSYDFAFTASGAPVPSFALASGALPDGLVLDQDGRLRGTPAREGRYNFSVAAQNRAGSATAGPYTMVIDVPLGVDQVVSFDRTTSATQLRSPAMAVSAGELVLAHVSADGPSSRRQRVTSLTGGGLRWSLAARSNDGRGTAEIWQAKTTQAISQLQVAAKLARYGYHGSITVASFKGRQVVGATSVAAAGSRGAPRVKLTPARDRSLVWAAGHASTRAQAPVAQPGQTIVHQFLDTRAKDTFWTQRLDGPASRGVPVRMGVSTPTRDRWQMVAVELAPTGG